MSAENASKNLSFEQFARLVLDAVEATGLEYLIGGAPDKGLDIGRFVPVGVCLVCNRCRSRTRRRRRSLVCAA